MVEVKENKEEKITWKDVEEIIKRTVREAKTEELKTVADAIKTLADYVKFGFEETNRRLEEHSIAIREINKRLEEHSRILEEHSKILEEHSKLLTKLVEEVASLKVMIGGFTSRGGIQMERMVLNIFRRTLLEMKGIDIEKIEKKGFRDDSGKLLKPGQKIDIDVYLSNKITYAIEVKSFVEDEDIDWIVAKKKFIEENYKLNAKWMIVTPAITEEAYTKAKESEIEVIYGAVIY